MQTRRPELRIITITILLGTLALALAVVIGYAWWSTQRGLSRHAQEKVDIIAQFLENGMELLPQRGADLGGLHILMAQVGEDCGARQLEVARGPAIARQYGLSDVSYVPDALTTQVFENGEGVTTVETREGRRVVRHLKALRATA